MSRTGVLLVNLGTPDSASTRDVRRYLRQFLSDPLVIDIPAFPRWLLLNLVILPFRPRKSAAAYAQIWTDAGSPLKLHGERLRDDVAAMLGNDFHVELAMRYREPSIADAVARAQAAGVDRWVVLPLFPQYSTAATLSAVNAVEDAFTKSHNTAPVQVIGAFYDAPGFIEAFATVIRPHLDAFRSDHVLFSYHGLPERQLRRLDASGSHCFASDECCDAITDVNRGCYRAQCVATTQLLVRELGLGPDAHSLSFQSRLGRTPWIQPHTDQVLPELAARGVKRLAVACPAFVADCLETLEEIAIRGRNQWLELGGEDFTLVPSLNSHPTWVDTVVALIHSKTAEAEAP
ncbi:MAG: ferrochelatase [Deltaproteobacteria bacterium]|nr:ferrochelatase [Deltaproteobacteria bacterium]